MGQKDNEADRQEGLFWMHCMEGVGINVEWMALFLNNFSVTLN
jgi:hypothetical protein